MNSSGKSMSIAIISSSVGKSPEDITSSFVFDEAHRLAKKGIDIHIIRSSVEDDSFSCGMCYHGLERRLDLRVAKYLLENVNIYPPISLMRNPATIYWENLYSLNVSRIVKNDAQLIHAHFAYPEGLVGLLAKGVTGKPLVVAIHGYDILIEPSCGYGIRLSRRMDAIVRRVIQEADAVITESRVTFDEASRIMGGARKVHLIPNGVDIQRFNPNIDGSKIKSKLGLEDRAIILALRAHEPKYGLEYLIRAVPMIVEKKEKVAFVIGGDGSLRRYHERLAADLGVKENTRFVGKIPQSEVPYYYAMSDVVVVPSLQEAFGLTVSEAMACGKPVIGTRVGGIPDQIIDGQNGFLVQPKNSMEISEKILQLISDSKKAKRLGANSRRIVEKRFDIDKRIDQIISLYERLLAGHP